MDPNRKGQIAVIFVSSRTGDDDAGYFAAAAEMESLAAAQPGYCGIVSAREPGGQGVTVSYWADDAAALAWRDHPDHRRVRDAGRARWYSDYTLHVARIERGYSWQRGD